MHATVSRRIGSVVNRRTLPVVAILVAVCALPFAVSAQEVRPLFVVEVPASTITNSTSSGLADRIGDSAGNTLFVIDHVLTPTNSFGPGSSVATPLGKQFVLVASTGQILASEDFAFPSAGIVHFFSPRKLLIQNISSRIEEFRPIGGRLASTGVVLTANGRSFSSQSPDTLPRKFIDAVSTTNGKVSRIERFNVSKLVPVVP